MIVSHSDSVIGIEKLVYGTPDMAMAKKMFADWGLSLLSQTDSEMLFACGNGNEIAVCPENAPGLPSRFKDGSNFREVIWAVANQDALAAIGRELARDREVREDGNGDGDGDGGGTLHSTSDKKYKTAAFNSKRPHLLLMLQNKLAISQLRRTFTRDLLGLICLLNQSLDTRPYGQKLGCY